MGTSQLNLSCSEEYRAKRTWLPTVKYKFVDYYNVAQRRQRRYAEHADERQLAQMRKELVSVLVEIVIEDGPAVQKVVALDAATLEQRFQEQSDKWWEETAYCSSPAQQMVHPSYQAILGMGASNPLGVAALMIRDMERNRRPWFMALSYLTHENPIKASDAGKTDKMIKAWIDWGKSQHVI